MTTSNFPNGATNVADSVSLGSYVAQDPTKVHSWFDDFDTFSATTGTTGGSEWLLTAAAAADTAAIEDADGGILLLTTDTATADTVYLQWEGFQPTPVESWTFTTGTPMWFKCRLKLAVAAGAALICGLAVTDSSPLDASDGIYFLKAAGSATMSLVVIASSTATTTTAKTMVDDTYTNLAWYYDGTDGIDIFVDEVKVARSVITNAPSTELAVTLGIKNNNATPRTARIDYIFVAKRRDTDI